MGFEELSNILLLKLMIEKKNMTGELRKDIENGSYYKIRKLIAAIQSLQLNPFEEDDARMEIIGEKWEVKCKNIPVQHPYVAAIDYDIQTLRELMYLAKDRLGSLDDPLVVKISQLLDEKLNQHFKLVAME